MSTFTQTLIYFALTTILVGCCWPGADDALDNTVRIEVFNADKSDNLLDLEGPIVFDSISLRYADTNIEVNAFQERSSNQLLLYPLDDRIPESGPADTDELILVLDSLSVPLNITYYVEDTRCSGKDIRIVSYNFNGQEFSYGAEFIRNELILCLDL